MQLKKINPLLQEALIENGLTEANEMQQETFSTIKSGADVVVQSPEGSGKTTAIVLNVIQRLEKSFGESTRALIIVETKERVLEMEESVTLASDARAKKLKAQGKDVLFLTLGQPDFHTHPHKPRLCLHGIQRPLR